MHYTITTVGIRGLELTAGFDEVPNASTDIDHPVLMK